MRTLSSKLTFGYAGVVTCTVAAVLVLGHVFLEHFLYSGMDLLNDTEYEEISEIMEAEVSGDSIDKALEGLKKHTEVDASLYFFQLSDMSGNIIFRSANMGISSLPITSIEGKALSITLDELGPVRVSTYQLGEERLQVASSLHSEIELFKQYNRIGYIAVVLIFPLSLAVGYGLSRLALNPVRRLQEVAQNITATSLDQRISVPDSGDEIAKLAQFLNQMLDRLETSFLQIQRFTAEASHELKTPISLVRLHAERLWKEPSLSKEESDLALQEILAEIDRINRIIADLLILAKSDSGALGLDLRVLDSRQFLTDFSEDARLLCEEAGLTFSLSLRSEQLITIDARWMRQVLLNLLSNAIRFSPKGGKVEIIFKEQDEALTICLADEGCGLPADKLEAVFERFMRLDTVGEEHGNGLGLAICKSIVQQHGGCISASNRSPHGLSVCICLPRDGV